MPHLVIEYAASLKDDINVQALVDAAFTGADESALFTSHDIKVRAIPYAAYSTAGTNQAFVHVEIKLLSGRTSVQKKDLAERVFAKVTANVPNTVAVSIETNDLDRDTYTKRV